MIDGHGRSLADALAIEFEHGVSSLASDELGEGVRAFQGGSGRGGSVRDGLGPA